MIDLTDPYELWYQRQYHKTYWSPYVQQQQAANRETKAAKRRKWENIKRAKERARTVNLRQTAPGKDLTIRALTRCAVDGVVCISNVRRFAGNPIRMRRNCVNLGSNTRRIYLSDLRKWLEKEKG